ncbi:MAG: NAD(P)/FAD-dependent oxidoreductase [Spirochaetota bacterium]|nr:NAD(P)/FAD-dependent oxidoreductase [Spirochaetota bacterium]
MYSRAQGHDVTLYEKHESVGGRIWGSRKNGNTFEMGPSMITELWVFDELFKVAGKTNPLTFSETPDFGFCIDQLLAVNITGFRSFLDEHDRKLLTTMISRFEKALPIIRNTVLDHPITGVFDLMGVSRLALTARVFRPLSTAVRAFHSRELEGLLSTYPAYTEKLIKDADSAALFAPMMMLIDGIYYSEGGIYRIVEEMYTACLEMGVKGHRNREVKTIRPEKNRIILNDSSFDHCIAAVDYSLTQNMLGRTAEHTAAHAYFAVCLGTDKLDIPHLSFIIPEDYEKGHRRIDDGKLPDSFLIYTCYTEREKPSLFLVTVPPSTQRIDYRARKQAIADKMIRQFQEKTKINLQVHAQEIMAPDDQEQRFGSLGGSVFGLSGKYNRFGFRPKNRDPKIRSLTYAGGSTVQPGNGVPLAIRSGMFAARIHNYPPHRQ